MTTQPLRDDERGERQRSRLPGAVDASPSSPGFDGRAPSEGAGGEETSPTGHAPRAERQSINYCPYCSEEDLFPLEGGGWECRSCRRAFSVSFRGLVPASRPDREEDR